MTNEQLIQQAWQNWQSEASKERQYDYDKEQLWRNRYYELKKGVSSEQQSKEK